MNKGNVLKDYPINKNIGEGFNNAIGFLNDVQFNFPKAISLAAGQPDENFFEFESHLNKLELFIGYVMTKTGKNRTEAMNFIGQYNKTKGIINDILAEHLKIDENIQLTGDDLLVTVGAQEAFSIILSTICNRDTDVVLVENPGYIGVSSFAKIFDFKIDGISTDNNGIDIQALRQQLIKIKKSGNQVKLLYTIPDYQNPSGSCMPLANRLALLDLADKHNFLIIEDSVYNGFTNAQVRNPTLKSLDIKKKVIFVNSFSKSLFPGLRLGFICADQMIENKFGNTIPLIDEMVKVKALLTNNTSTINQAILGGVLIYHNYSLQECNKLKYENYRVKRQKMLDCLNTHIKQFSNTWAKGISWNEPEGGFFIKMTVPFVVTSERIYECAREFNVVVCPMKYFYLGNGGDFELRLTFSNISLNTIEIGVKRLSAYLKSILNKNENERVKRSNDACWNPNHQ
jgi:(S)-3,5-dihydroxyphenylglycine transaminase